MLWCPSNIYLANIYYENFVDVIYLFNLKLQGRQSTFTELSKLPLEGSPDICNFNLTYVNKLREYWHRGQHCLIIDDQVYCFHVMFSSSCALFSWS